MFGENLRELRKKAGYTQGEYAKQLGISASAVGMYEQGRREPDQKLLLKMAETLGVSVDRLLGEKTDELELTEMIDDVVRRLTAQSTLTHAGRKLDDEEIQSIVNAIRLGVEFAVRDINEEK